MFTFLGNTTLLCLAKCLWLFDLFFFAWHETRDSRLSFHFSSSHFITFHHRCCSWQKEKQIFFINVFPSASLVFSVSISISVGVCVLCFVFVYTSVGIVIVCWFYVNGCKLQLDFHLFTPAKTPERRRRRWRRKVLLCKLQTPNSNEKAEHSEKTHVKKCIMFTL